MSIMIFSLYQKNPNISHFSAKNMKMVQKLFPSQTFVWCWGEVKNHKQAHLSIYRGLRAAEHHIFQGSEHHTQTNNTNISKNITKHNTRLGHFDSLIHPSIHFFFFYTCFLLRSGLRTICQIIAVFNLIGRKTSTNHLSFVPSDCLFKTA